MIHQANDWASPMVIAFWRASWQGGLFIVAIWIACRLFKRMPAWSKNWLWWVASLQLAARLFLCISVPVLPATEIASDTPAIEAPLPAQFVQSLQLVSTKAVQAAPTTVPVIPPVSAVPERPAERPSLALALVGAWLLGCLALLALSFRHLFALRRLLKHSQLPEPGLDDLVRDLASEIGVKAPRVRISKDAPCPMLAGWLMPTIILPEWAVDLENRELELALYHELVHLKRQDLWLALLPALVKCLFFFHPLAWLAAHEASLACEEACDLETLCLSSGSPATYARLLLHSAQTKSSVVALGTAFGFRSLHRRITMLKRLNLSAPARRTRSLTIIIALAAVCALPWSVTAQSSTSGKHHSLHAKRGHRTSSHAKVAKAAKSAKPAAAAKPAVASTPAKPATATAGQAPAGDHYVRVVEKRGDSLVDTTVLQSQLSKLSADQNTKVAFVGGFPADAQGGIGGSGLSGSRTTSALAKTHSGMGGGGFGGGAGASGLSTTQAGMGGGGGLAASPAKGQTGMGGGGFVGGARASGLSTTQAGMGGGGIAGGRISGDSSTVHAAPAAPQGLGGGEVATGLSDVHESAGQITVRFKNAELREALAAVFNEAKVDFTIKSDVSFNNMVTCGFNHAELSNVIRAMLDSVDQKLTYRVEGGMYIIMARDGN